MNMLSLPLGKIIAIIMSLLPQYILPLMEVSDLYRATVHHMMALVHDSCFFCILSLTVIMPLKIFTRTYQRYVLAAQITVTISKQLA